MCKIKRWKSYNWVKNGAGDGGGEIGECVEYDDDEGDGEDSGEGGVDDVEWYIFSCFVGLALRQMKQLVSTIKTDWRMVNCVQWMNQKKFNPEEEAKCLTNQLILLKFKESSTNIWYFRILERNRAYIAWLF